MNTDTIDIDKLRYAAKMSFRCDFVRMGTLNQNPLTKKGWGITTNPKLWRVYNKVLCLFDKKYKRHLLHWIYLVEQNNIPNNN